LPFKSMLVAVDCPPHRLRSIVHRQRG
jgi:hypothetical protein